MVSGADEMNPRRYLVEAHRKYLGCQIRKCAAEAEQHPVSNHSGWLIAYVEQIPAAKNYGARKPRTTGEGHHPTMGISWQMSTYLRALSCVVLVLKAGT